MKNLYLSGIVSADLNKKRLFYPKCFFRILWCLTFSFFVLSKVPVNCKAIFLSFQWVFSFPEKAEVLRLQSFSFFSLELSSCFAPILEMRLFYSHTILTFRESQTISLLILKSVWRQNAKFRYTSRSMTRQHVSTFCVLATTYETLLFWKPIFTFFLSWQFVWSAYVISVLKSFLQFWKPI